MLLPISRIRKCVMCDFPDVAKAELLTGAAGKCSSETSRGSDVPHLINVGNTSNVSLNRDVIAQSWLTFNQSLAPG